MEGFGPGLYASLQQDSLPLQARSQEVLWGRSEERKQRNEGVDGLSTSRYRCNAGIEDCFVVPLLCHCFVVPMSFEMRMCDMEERLCTRVTTSPHVH